VFASEIGIVMFARAVPSFRKDGTMADIGVVKND